MNNRMVKIVIVLFGILLTGCYCLKKYPAREDFLLKKAKQIYSKKTKDRNVDPILIVSVNYSFPYSKILWDYDGEQIEMKYEGEKPGPNVLSTKEIGGIQISSYYGKILYIPLHFENVEFYFRHSKDGSIYCINNYNKFDKKQQILYKDEMCRRFKRVYLVPNLGLFGYEEGKLYKIENYFWNTPQPLKYTLVSPKDSISTNDISNRFEER